MQIIMFCSKENTWKNRRERKIVTYIESHILTHLSTQAILSNCFIHSNFATQEFENQETQDMSYKDVY